MFSVNPFSKKPFSNGSGNPAIANGYNIDTYNNPFGNPSTSLGLEGSVTLPNYQDFISETINTAVGAITGNTSQSPATITENHGGTGSTGGSGAPPKMSFSEKFSKSTFGKNFGAWSAGIGLANNLFTTFAGEKDEYSGAKGGLARGVDQGYDTVQSVVGMLGPIGQAASLIMGGNKLLGNVMNKVGGGTDGMCVCAGTKVFTSTGKVVNIEDLQKEDGIIGWNEETKEIKPQTIHNFIEPRQKECIEIVLKNGYFIRCSIDHPILSDTNPKAKSKYINGKRMAIREWKFRRADELKTGDFVGLANNIDYWGDNHLDNAYLVGLLIGDGSYGKGASCRIISADQDTWKYLEDNNLGIINHCDDSRPEKYNKEIRTYRIIGGMKLLHQLGISYQTGKNKTLPKNIGTFDKSSVCNLLAGLFDTDGSISVNEEKETYSITLYQLNIDLLEEVRTQLHKLGIFSTIGTRKATKYELGGKIINSKESYRLEIHDISSALKFCNLIPLNISYKKENLSKIQNMLKDKKAQEHNDISGAKQCKIVSIIPIGVQTVYNLQADYDHTYLANCIITHNTTTDAILNSSFLQLTPLGLINGFGGQKAMTITKDNQAFAQVGSSYSGTSFAVDDALSKSGKKYGLFSSGARDKANREILDARRQQQIMSNVADTASDRFALSDSMAAINNSRMALNLMGGYDQSSVRVGKAGMILQLARGINSKPSVLKEITEIPTEFLEIDEFKEGGTIPKKTRTLEELIQYAKESNPRFIQRLSEAPKGIDFIDDEGNQARGSHYLAYSTDDEGNAIIYPRIQEIDGELKLLNDEDAYNRARENNNNLIMTVDEAKIFFKEDPEFGTAYKKGWPEFFKKFQNGGILKEVTEIPTEFLEIDEFKKGGKFNIIPEGALHARKHNMDVENITQKGIPVVSESADGEIVQQAEIERNEVILRLEVTKKLEELQKNYYNDNYTQKQKDEFAIEAGKLLAYELLENTIDNTGLLNKI